MATSITSTSDKWANIPLQPEAGEGLGAEGHVNFPDAEASKQTQAKCEQVAMASLPQIADTVKIDLDWVEIESPEVNYDQLPVTADELKDGEGYVEVPDAPIPAETFDISRVSQQVSEAARVNAQTAYDYASNPTFAVQLTTALLATWLYVQFATAAAATVVAQNLAGQGLAGYAATRGADAAIDNRVGRAVTTTVYGNVAYAATKTVCATASAVNWNMHAARENQMSVVGAVFG